MPWAQSSDSVFMITKPKGRNKMKYCDDYVEDLEDLLEDIRVTLERVSRYDNKCLARICLDDILKNINEHKSKHDKD